MGGKSSRRCHNLRLSPETSNEILQIGSIDRFATWLQTELPITHVLVDYPRWIEGSFRSPGKPTNDTNEKVRFGEGEKV